MSLVGVYTLVILAAFFGGANIVLANFVLADFSPQWTAALRFGMAALILLGVAAWQKAPLLALAQRHSLRYLVLGMVGIAGFNLLFFFAMMSTSIDNAALIMATNPLMTTVLAGLILREHPGWQRLIALPVALTGVAVVISNGHITQMLSQKIVLGDWLMLAGNVCWALYNVLNRRLLPLGINPIANTALIVTAGALVLIIVAGLDPSGLKQAPSSTALEALAGIVLGGTVFFYLFWTIGIARLGAGRTALFLNLVPVFAMLTAMTLGERPTSTQLLGGAIVFGATLISMLPNRKKPLVQLKAA
jgi:drug/metabolite transporter (DMT)-like permease